jgi:hypothetical protein
MVPAIARNELAASDFVPLQWVMVADSMLERTK